MYELSTGPLRVELKTFHSPRESLQYLENNEADLVFLDILMRETDGFTTLKRLREIPQHENTPVVMVTSKDYAQDRSAAKSLGARDFLVKPLRSQEIRDIICRYTGSAQESGQC